MTRTELILGWSSFPVRLADAAGAATDRPVVSGEWGPAEIVRHLIAVEREVYWSRLASIHDEAEPFWSWIEPGLEPGLDDAPQTEVLARFAAARARSVEIIAGFTDADWARTGVHATFGRLDVEGLIGIITDHDEEHLAGLARRPG